MPASGAVAVSRSMLLRRSSGSPPFVVHVKPVAVPQPDYGARHIAALILIIDLRSQHRIDPDSVARTLGLTPMEPLLHLHLLLCRCRAGCRVIAANGLPTPDPNPSVLAYNLGNLWRRLGLPNRIKSWSLTSLQHRLTKTGGRLIKNPRYYWLLLAEGYLNRRLFASMLGRIDGLALPSG